DGRRIEDERFQRLLGFLAADPRFAEQFPGEQGKEEKKGLARQLLTFLIHQEVIEDFASQRGLEVDDATVDQRFQQAVEEAGGQGPFDEQLATAGATRADVEELLRKQAMREMVAQQVVTQGIPETRLRQAYDERITEFTQVHVAHILVQDAALAERLARQATPRNFAALAREHSEDTGSAPEGGDLGTRPASEFVDPFGSTALEIPVGEIGGPIETEFGHHVIHVIERTAMPFEEVRDQLLGESGQEFFTTWLLDRVKRADVLVNPRYGVFDEEAGEVVERTSTTPLPGATPDVQVEP
ncbi:MAG TPA: peptidylprolyl isomerase, partial [Actinomycetota bacterium]